MKTRLLKLNYTTQRKLTKAISLVTTSVVKLLPLALF
jgi:hypothetical protein